MRQWSLQCCRFACVFCVVLLATAVICIRPAVAESTIACPGGQIDVLDWLTLDADLRNSKYMSGSHPLYTEMWPGKFYWLKSHAGTTWDIQLFDLTNVYLWITERVWNDPYSYKRFAYDTNLMLMRRCATPGYPGTVLYNPVSDYRIAQNCVEGPIGNLAYVTTQLWGPYTAGQPGLEPSHPRIGGDIPDATPVYTIAYMWACNSAYANCGVKEEFILAQRYGLVRWNEWTRSGSTYYLTGSSTFNTLMNGSTSPDFRCF